MVGGACWEVFAPVAMVLSEAVEQGPGSVLLCEQQQQNVTLAYIALSCFFKHCGI